MSPRSARLIALAAWALLVGGSRLAVLLFDLDVFVGFAPLNGVPGWHGTLAWAVVPVVVGLALVALGPGLSRRLGWGTLLVASAVAAATWAMALAVSGGGIDGLTAPVAGEFDYLGNLPLPPDFLGTFVDRLGDYTVHVRGHPPGTLLLLAGLDAVGLGGPEPAAVLFVTAGAAAVPAVLVALRETAGEARARAAAPFLVLAPAAIWIATTADALYLGLSAWGIALVILATGRRDAGGGALALAGGLLLGLALHGSYGIVPLGAVVGVVAIARRRIRPLLWTAAGMAVVTAAFVIGGFWWFSGLAATADQYREGISSVRPYGYFVIGNLAAFAVAVGPAAAAGIGSLRDRGTWLLVGGGLIALLAADLSGLSKGEVERIWLPFVPWVACATASFATDDLRPWLGLTAATALAVELFVRTPW